MQPLLVTGVLFYLLYARAVLHHAIDHLAVRLDRPEVVVPAWLRVPIALLAGHIRQARRRWG